MQLLPLLLLCFFVIAEATRLTGRTNSTKDRIMHRFGKMSEETKQRLSKQIGSLDARKARLAKLNRPHKQLTPEQQAELQETLNKLTPIQTESFNEKVPTDLFEVNMKEGMSEYMYQGDIDLTDEQVDRLAASSDPARKKRQVTSVVSKWTNNNAYYYFDSSINALKKSVVMEALQFIQSRTCVNFIQSSTAANRIKVFNGGGCYSTVGMIGGEQTLSIGNGCEYMGTAAHEFMHALGIWHMQQRSDRDNYVIIDFTYVPEGSRGQFNKLSSSETINYTPYEYGSMMHYLGNSFTDPSDKLSIIPKDTRYAYTLANIQPSFYDIMMINKHYGCDAACFASASVQCKNGGVPNPRNCATCICPWGWQGTLCEQTVNTKGCGEILTATSNWQSKSFTFGDPSDPVEMKDNYTYCTSTVTAPVGQTIEIQLSKMSNRDCRKGCAVNGFTIKDDVDTRITSPKYCCDEFINKPITSKNNPTTVIIYTKNYYIDFAFQYRFVPGVKATTQPPKPACDAGWTQFNSFCYFIGTQEISAVSAQILCKSLGADLASIHSSAENAFVRDIPNTKNVPIRSALFWIGSSRIGPKTTDFRNYDGTPMDYTNWLAQQPDNYGGNQNCTAMIAYASKTSPSYAQWDDDMCSNDRNYVCKKPVNKV